MMKKVTIILFIIPLGVLLVGLVLQDMHVARVGLMWTLPAHVLNFIRIWLERRKKRVMQESNSNEPQQNRNNGYD